VIKYPDHFPETQPEYSPEALSKLSPAKRLKAEQHIAKMKAYRDGCLAELRAIDQKHNSGVCYCDREYSCPLSSQRFHAAYQDRLNRNARLQELKLLIKTAAPGESVSEWDRERQELKEGFDRNPWQQMVKDTMCR